MDAYSAYIQTDMILLLSWLGLLLESRAACPRDVSPPYSYGTKAPASTVRLALTFYDASSGKTRTAIRLRAAWNNSRDELLHVPACDSERILSGERVYLSRALYVLGDEHKLRAYSYSFLSNKASPLLHRLFDRQPLLYLLIKIVRTRDVQPLQLRLATQLRFAFFVDL